MLSAGMFSAFAARMAVRRRGLASGSPPPMRAATVISLIILVKILPRLASSAPFLCLIVAHFECPDIIFLSFQRPARRWSQPVLFPLRAIAVGWLSYSKMLPHFGARCYSLESAGIMGQPIGIISIVRGLSD